MLCRSDRASVKNLEYQLSYTYNIAKRKYREYLEPVSYTHLINDVTYEQPEKYGDISIRFSMRSEDGGCYFWSYEEDWEVRAEMCIRDSACPLQSSAHPY